MISTNDYSGRKKIQDFIAFCHLGDAVKVIRAGGAACLFLVYPSEMPELCQSLAPLLVGKGFHLPLQTFQVSCYLIAFYKD